MSLLAFKHAGEVLEHLAENDGCTLSDLVDLDVAGKTAIDEYTKLLVARGALTRRRGSGSRAPHAMSLTDYGHGLEELAYLVKRWLDQSRSPLGPLDFADPAGSRMIQSRAEGWGNQILLATEIAPRTRSEMVARLGEPPATDACGLDTGEKVSKRIDWMLETGQIERDPEDSELRFTPTDWARRGMGCVALAMWLEVAHEPPNVASPSRRVVLLNLLQASRLLTMSLGLEVKFRLEIDVGEENQPLRVTCDSASGRCYFGLDDHPRPDVVIAGTLSELLGWIVGGLGARPALKGDVAVGQAVLVALKDLGVGI